MVEFYDPDAADRDRAEGQTEIAAPEAAPTVPRPIAEWVVVGVAAVGTLFIAFQQGWGGAGMVWIALMQFAYPLSIALLAGAVASLLVRRVLRAHREVIADELLRMHLGIEGLQQRLDAPR